MGFFEDPQCVLDVVRMLVECFGVAHGKVFTSSTSGSA